MKARKFKSIYKTLEDFTRDAYEILNSEPTFTVTLTTGTAATVVSNVLVGKDSVIHLMPTSVEAGRVFGTHYITVSDQSFTINHLTATLTATFSFDIYG